MNSVYLAGGMRSNWRKRVAEECNNINIISPKDKEVQKDMSLDEYGSWDLHYIRKSDIVFGYMEQTNPSGIGLSCELGYAHGIGKTVILVLEKDNHYFKDRYLNFMKKVSSVTFENLDNGIEYLTTFE